MLVWVLWESNTESRQEIYWVDSREWQWSGTQKRLRYLPSDIFLLQEESWMAHFYCYPRAQLIPQAFRTLTTYSLRTSIPERKLKEECWPTVHVAFSLRLENSSLLPPQPLSHNSHTQFPRTRSSSWLAFTYEKWKSLVIIPSSGQDCCVHLFTDTMGKTGSRRYSSGSSRFQIPFTILLWNLVLTSPRDKNRLYLL